MKIKKVKIKNVTAEIDERDRLLVKMNLDRHFSKTQWSLDLNKSEDAETLMKLMGYLEVHNTKDLNGKIVRIIDDEGDFCGFGHPVEDKFIIFEGSYLVEVSKEQLEERL